MKSIRPIVRSVILGTLIGDTSSLANPQAIESIRARLNLQQDEPGEGTPT